MLWSILLLSLLGYVSSVQVRMCANHWCTEPVYRGTAAEDWSNDHPGYLPLVKGAPVTVFGVEKDYYDAESGGARGFIPKDKAIITETVHEPKVKFNPYYKEEDVPNEDIEGGVLHDDIEDGVLHEDIEDGVLHEDNENNVLHEDNESDERDSLAEPQTLSDIEGTDDQSKIGDNLDSVLTGTEQIEQEKKDDEEERIRKEQLQQKRIGQEKLKNEILERQKLKLKEEIRSRQKIEQEKKLEEQRLELQKLELQRLDQKRLEQIKLEQERMEQQKLDQQKAEQDRIEQQKMEQQKLTQQKLEQERIEQQKLELVREQKRLENERLENERLENERLENERLENERFENERLENERLENERLENKRLENERLENERLKNERLENERLENKRLENERLENERLENERLKNERLENEKRENEKIESERLEKEMLENERIENERNKKERFEKEKLENERIENEKLKEENEKEMHKKEGEEAKKAAFLAKKKELEEQYRLRREEKKKKQSTHDKHVKPSEQHTEVSTDHQEQQNQDTLSDETDTSDTPVEEAQDSLASPVEEAQDSLDPPVEEAETAVNEGVESISGDEALGSTGEYDEGFDDIGELPEPHIPEDVSTKKEDRNTRNDENLNRDSTIKEPVHDFRSRYKAIKKQSLPFYCSFPVLESLCDTVGSDAAILIVISTVFVGGLLAFVCLSGPSIPETTPQKTVTPPLKEDSKSDPKVLEKLDEQAKAQKQFAGNLDDVLEKLARLTKEIKDLGSENKRYQAQLQTTQNKLTAATERTVKLENESRDLRSQLHEQTGYNAGFVELENSLKQQMSEMEEKIANCRDIINTQESTALSTSDQIATLQTQLESTIIERDTTQSELTAANSKVIELVSCLECTQEKLNTTQDLLDQAESDTEAWVVRVQILALELEDAESSIANLKEDLESKSRDVDVIRECLVELRAQADEDGDIDISSRFKDMVDVHSLKMENEKLVEANRDVHAELEEVREAHDCFEERVQDVEEEMDVLRTEKEEKEAKLREVTTTFEALSTYFKEKEDGLHCRLSELQVKCKQLEEESSEANILFYKEELSRIKKSHAENERNLTLQIQTNERKAKDAFAQLRSKDAKLKDTTELLKKLKKSNGSGSAIPEERPAPGPPFLDYPPPQLRKGGPTESPSESSCTSAEDLETRRLERNMDFENDLYPPDLRPFDDIRYGPRPYPDDMYRDGIYTPRDYPPPFDPRAMEPPRSRDSSRPPSAGRDDRLPPSRDPTFYTRDLPPRDLPPRDYPARDIQPQSLPPRDFAPRDAPLRVKPQYVPREVPKDIVGPMMPPRDVPRIPSRDGSGIPPVVPSRNASSLHRVNSNSEPDNISISATSETSFNMGV